MAGVVTPRVVPDLATPQRVHVVAAGGAAMSAICHILTTMGHHVTGSDQAPSDALDRLRAEGLTMTVGHDENAVIDTDVVIVSTAIKPGNVELEAAIRRGIPISGRPDVMEALGALTDTLAISGTHGKTTTSAMAATAATAIGWNPSFIVGGVVNQLGTGVRWTGGRRFVVEADESDNSFIRFRANDVIVTNIEADHLDFHGDMNTLETMFDRFVTQGSGQSTVCVDDPGVNALIKRVGRDRVCTYGTAENAEYRIEELATSALFTHCSIRHHGVVLADLSLVVPGEHNARNATAVLAAMHGLGADPTLVAASLSAFTGVGRRFEYRGEAAGVTFVDDYAHLPTEVAAVVSSASKGGWGRVVAVFQPHRFTRIRDVGADFATSFDGADLVIITGLYAAGQSPIDGISGRTVFDAIRAARPHQAIEYIETRRELESHLSDVLASGDLCLTMNAGDLTTLPDVLIAQLALRS
jgi:UDP-N-acetylmuramate--alanine ligase